MAGTKSRTSIKLIQLYQNLHNTNEIDYKAISDWAVEEGYYKKKPISAEEQCEADLRRAVKHASYTDPQGHKVRIFGIPRIEFEGEMLTLSPVDMRVAKPEIAQNVFDSNYKGIANDVKRHSIEKQSYDDNNPYGAILPMFDYDFNQVAADAVMTGQYDDNFDEDEFDENDEDED
jgi:hypothetical protein